MSPEEKEKLYDAIGYEGNNTSTSSYPDTVRPGFQNLYLFNKVYIYIYIFQYVDMDLSIRLNTLDVNIWSKINPTDSKYFNDFI